MKNSNKKRGARYKTLLPLCLQQYIEKIINLSFVFFIVSTCQFFRQVQLFGITEQLVIRYKSKVIRYKEF